MTSSSPSPLTAASQTYLSAAFPPGAPLQRDIPLADGRVKMETYSRMFGGDYVSLRRVEDLRLPTLDGTASFPIRVYWPKVVDGGDGERLPVILYVHGGGYVKGNLNTHDQLCRRLAAGSGHALVAVDYRLSPEVRFPAALDDAEAAFRWVTTQPGFDPAQISVGGDSAGGNLASALVVRLLAKVTTPHVQRQFLIYPVLDMRLQGESYQTYGAGYGLSNVSIQYYIESYLGPAYTDAPSPEARQALLTNPEVSPLLFDKPDQLPPTLLVTAEADPLASDAQALAEKLREAQVPVTHVVYPGTVHAYMTLFDVFPESAASVQDIVNFLKTHTP